MKTQISRVTKTRNRNPFVILSSEALKTMKTSLLNIETVTEYDDMLGVETLHPLVSVIDLSQAKPMHHMRHTFSFYVIFLKDEKNCDLIYGRQRYDYQKGSVVCLAPGQVIGIEDTGANVPAARLCAVLSSRPDSRHQPRTHYQGIHVLLV